jgi:glycopeptide antibiotics resistance protein
MSSQGQPDKFLQIVTWVLFIFCMLVLTRYILFKGVLDETKVTVSSVTGKKTITRGFKRANIVPFATLKLFYSVRRKYTYVAKNVLGNIIGFMPLGVLLPVLFGRLQRWYRTILTVMLISLAFEIIQLVTGRGVFDVDDIILNTFGAAIGYFFYYVSNRLMSLNNNTSTT